MLTMYGKTIARILSVLLLPCMAVTVFAADIAGSKPNIVLVLVDDMGFSDLGCYGGEIDTPVLDELAESGLRFSQFTNSAKCTTSRYSLLSGQWHGAGYSKMNKSTTLAEPLGKQGMPPGRSVNGILMARHRWTTALRNISVLLGVPAIISRVMGNSC